MTVAAKERSRFKGRFVDEAHPPSRKVLVCLPEPFIEALDAYGKEHGTGRGGSIQKLLEGVLTPPAPPGPLPVAQKHLVRLELVQRSNPLYQQFRQAHYIPERGLVGQQLLYLIFYANEVVGVIGGASAVFANEARDEFFGLSSEKDLKTRQLNSIVNNAIYRLEHAAPNLASIVLSKWRKQIAIDWQRLYGVEVAGFETFVVEERLWNGQKRDGACYRADGWSCEGITRGYGDTNIRGREHKSKTLKSKKLVYCKWIPGKELCTDYTTAWNDKERTKELARKRESMIPDPLESLLSSIRD